ncbi:MAG: alpha-N-arabinofuranosidase [Verrucomicrobia bacterium]|nr:alpha-N-arabinofuranosidase [Verrucomicrobiota bacterium]
MQTAAKGLPVSPVLYGIFFEDINYAADGGLYAEMVQNRSFEYYSLKTRHSPELAASFSPLFAWEPVERSGLKARLEASILQPLHRQNPTYLVLTTSGAAGEAGVANRGFGTGMPVKAGARYDVSLYARRLAGEPGPLQVTVEAPDGRVVGRAELPAAGAEWGKREASFVASASETQARLVVTVKTAGRLALDMISLFPRETFKGRRNGLRADLAQAIADLHPKTVRFPGGCIVHGDGLANAYRWKDTVGDVAHRRPNFNRWGYHQSYGLGYFEYLQFCEDIGAAPLPILPCGVSCGFSKPFQVADDSQLQEWIQDAVDLVEFANGPVESRWGRLRAEMGHPAPFGLKYLGLGNEEHDTTSFREVFPRFVEALRRRHPEIQIVGTSGLGPGIPLFDLMERTGVALADEHYYQAPEWFIANHRRFDAVPRRSPKIYVGEYASRGNKQYNAVAEAVYLTGIERNVDQVVMTAYAPLLARYDFTQWMQANLIWFDATQLVLTPNYHVQRLFATNQGDWMLPVEVKTTPETLVVGVSVARLERDGTLILKIANPSESEVAGKVVLGGWKAGAGTASRVLLAGEKTAGNDREQPNRVVPQSDTVGYGPTFDLRLPPMSVQVIRVPGRF